jgi:serine/threonine protein kinase
VVDAVAYMHARHVIHCDIKGDNIVLDAALARPVLLDFELSKEADKRIAGELVAQSTLLHGTLAYWAPELLTGTQGRPTAKSDVFALGRVLFELFLPGALKPLEPILTLDPTLFPATCDPLLRDLLEKMLARSPEERVRADEALKHAFFTRK